MWDSKFSIDLFYRVDGAVDSTINTVSAGVVTAIRIPIQMTNRANERALSPTVTFNLPQGTDFIRAFDASTVSFSRILTVVCCTKIFNWIIFCEFKLIMF